MPDPSLIPELPNPQQIQTGLRVFDLLGTAAFALSGALLGVRKRFDLFGVVVLGAVTATGGGAIRDALTDRFPPTFLRDETYMWIALVCSLIAFVAGERLVRFDRTLRLFDSIGLAIFASSGALGAMGLGLGPLGVAFAAMLSGVGGGIVRDLIANEVPEVMYRRDHLYATAAALGGVVVYLLRPHLGVLATQLAAIGAVLLVRYVSSRGWVRLPLPKS